MMMLVEYEPDAGHHDPFQPALQNRRHRAPPCRVDEDECLGTLDDVGMSLGHRIEQWSLAVIRQPFGRAHRRAELFGVQIEQRDLVAGAGQRGHCGRCDRMVETARVRVGKDDKDTHSGRTLVAPPTIPRDGIAGTPARPCVDLLRRFRRAGERPQHRRAGALAHARQLSEQTTAVSAWSSSDPRSATCSARSSAGDSSTAATGTRCGRGA